MEEYLGRCLDTMVASDLLSSLEIIIVNDGSTDRSLSIAIDYQERYPESIKVIDKKNEHYGSCVMAGLEQATGKYFRMVDADDWVNTRSLNYVLQQLSVIDTDLVVTLRSEWSYDKCDIPNITVRPFDKRIECDKEYNLKQFVISDYVLLDEFNMHSMTYKTSVLRSGDGLKLPKRVCYTDFLYSFYPIDRAETLIFLDVPLYVYYMGRDEQSISSKSLKRNLHHICTVLNLMISYYEKEERDIVIRKNQMYFILKAMGFFSGCFFHRNDLTEKEYDDVLPILLFLEKHHIPNRLYEKRYFRLFRKRKSRKILNFCLRAFTMAHQRFVKTPLVLQYIPRDFRGLVSY